MASPAALLQLEDTVSRAAKIGLSWSQKRDSLLIDEKSAGQFASNADLEIERFLRAELADHFPGQSIIGEELGGELDEAASGWAIDPIDGTSNFVLGLPIWGISVGYLENGRSVLGAIALPDLNLLVSARRSGGIRINQIETRDLRPKSAVKILALGENDYETGPETDARAEAYRDAGYSVVRYRCAVFALAMSAMGRLSGYIENGCGLWDMAAAEVICREAGLNVETSNIASGRYHIDVRWSA